jgi:hypothetical protein
MMRNLLQRTALRWPPTFIGLLALSTAVLPACEPQTVFEGEPVVAPPVAEFDRAATADRAIHGGALPVGVVVSDRFVGIDSVTVRFSGAMAGSFTRRYAGAPKQVRIDTVLAVPFGIQGEVLLETFALNRFGSRAQADTLVAVILRQDTIRPTSITQQLAVPARLELADTIRVRVVAHDDQFGSGIARMGVIIRDDLTQAQPVMFPPYVLPAPAQAADHEYRIPVMQLPGPATARPRSLTFVAYAIDQAGNCTAVGAAGTPVPCTVSGGQAVVQGVAGAAAATEVTGTRSFSQAAPTAAQIGDLVVDTNREVVYISNKANNSVDRISWAGPAPSLSRTGRELVGSRPWGMTLNRTGDTLIVANSGGTSLSYVGLAQFNEARRFETPNATLWQIDKDSAFDAMILSHLDFSDRPQFVAQDQSGVVLYSTTPTAAAPHGAIRMVQWNAAWQQRESDLVLWTQVVEGNGWGPNANPRRCWDPVTFQNVIDDPACVIAFVDSVRIHYENPMLGTQLRVYDHVPGFPNQVIADTSASLHQILTRLQTRGSDIFMYRGQWRLDDWLNADTTFVAASGNGAWVGIAEGARDPGRVWLWGAIGQHPRLHDRWISDFVNISDYTNNTSARTTAFSVNHTGFALATRSQDTVFFVTNPLRLRGMYTSPDIRGGSGLALHPDAAFEGGDQNSNWAAAGSGEAHVILIDTRHFRRVGRIALVEPVAGPLRVIRRRAADPADVVGHIFGVTQSGAIFHVPVRTTDIDP